MPKVPTTIDVDAVVAGVIDDASADETDAAILDAAGTLMITAGIAGVEIDVVAARSGVARSTIYRRFGSRNGVLAAALAHEARRFFSALASDVDAAAGSGSGDGLASVADRVVDAFARGLAFARVAGLTALVRSEPLLLQMVTVDGGPLIAAARNQLVLEAKRRAPHLDLVTVGHQAEVLVRLAISYVVTPPVGDPALADAAVLDAIAQVMVPTTGQTPGERSAPSWDQRG